MNKEHIFKNETMASKCAWTPFNNMAIKGFPIATIINGKVVMADGKVLKEGSGQPLEF